MEVDRAEPKPRSSGPSESLAPPASPYPAQVDPSPVDSNGTESTEIEDEKQDGVKSPTSEQGEELQSPSIEITSPQSDRNVWPTATNIRSTGADIRRTVYLESIHGYHQNDQTQPRMHRNLSSTHQMAIKTLKTPNRRPRRLLSDQSTPLCHQPRQRLSG